MAIKEDAGDAIVQEGIIAFLKGMESLISFALQETRPFSQRHLQLLKNYKTRKVLIYRII